jgi:hypothetical protein
VLAKGPDMVLIFQPEKPEVASGFG